MDHAKERAAVINESLKWLGTPFRDHARVQGRYGGVDCGQLLYAVYHACGIIGEVEGPSYNLQFMMNHAEEMYVDQLLKYSREIAADVALPGDVFSLRWGRCYSHSGILLAPWCGKVIHALNGFGVIVTDAKRDSRIQATIQKFRQFPPRFFRPTQWV